LVKMIDSLTFYQLLFFQPKRKKETPVYLT
jgi:hypothetical protein